MEQLSVMVVVVAVALQADTVVKLVRGQSWEAPLDEGEQYTVASVMVVLSVQLSIDVDVLASRSQPPTRYVSVQVHELGEGVGGCVQKTT